MISHAWLQKRTYTDKDLDWLFTDPIYSSSKDKTTNSLKIFSDSRPVGVRLLFHVTFLESCLQRNEIRSGKKLITC